VRAVQAAAHRPDTDRRQRQRRVAGWASGGLVVWVLSGWPIAGLAVTVVGLWAPWLLGSSRVVHERIDRLEALETWCRRMADVLAGGGTVGLTQAITSTARHNGSHSGGRSGASTAASVEERIAPAVATLARRLRDGDPVGVAVREFADAVDDRVGDTVAAALWLALHQQSSGVGKVLRQLADGVARDVRERRRIEAERAESRQSIRMLLLIQAGVLVMLAFVPTFAAAYTTAAGQAVMAILLAATVALLVWMRRLALGRQAPRFLTGHTTRGGAQTRSASTQDSDGGGPGTGTAEDDATRTGRAPAPPVVWEVGR
jgi:hypothetical protein